MVVAEAEAAADKCLLWEKSEPRVLALVGKWGLGWSGLGPVRGVIRPVISLVVVVVVVMLVIKDRSERVEEGFTVDRLAMDAVRTWTTACTPAVIFACGERSIVAMDQEGERSSCCFVWAKWGFVRAK